MINYLTGDVLKPIGAGNKLIIHCCNTIGGFGSGVAGAINRKWDGPRIEYKTLADSHSNNIPLGIVQAVKVEHDITVVNMIGQEGIGWKNGIAPIRYEAIKTCLEQVAKYAINNNCSIHAPRFGSGLAGGDWNQIEAMIIAIFIQQGISVNVYDLPTAENLTTEINKRKQMDLL